MTGEIDQLRNCEHCGDAATRMYAELQKPEFIGTDHPGRAFMTIFLCEDCFAKIKDHMFKPMAPP